MATNYRVKDVMTAFVLIKDYCPDYDPREYRKTKKEVSEISDKGHAIKVGKAHNLVKSMIEMRAKKSEISRAVKYLWVVIDMKKFNLDHKRAYDDLGIEKLGKKYYSKVSML